MKRRKSGLKRRENIEKRLLILLDITSKLLYILFLIKQIIS
ncbi:hypothetical protein [Clostridium hydrogeniformans]|nr:hypothetical protein [Clostridium hydrogeniformans]